MPRVSRRRDEQADACASARLRRWAVSYGTTTLSTTRTVLSAEAVAHRGFGVVGFDDPQDAGDRTSAPYALTVPYHTVPYGSIVASAVEILVCSADLISRQ